MSRLDPDEIVETAAELFAARGYATVTIADIVEQLGCTPPRLYRRFPSKLALLHAVLEKALQRQACPDCDLAQHISGTLKAAAEHPGLMITYIRDQRWIDPVEFGEVARRSADHQAGWRAAISAAAPDLPRLSIAVRQQAIEGVVAASVSAPRSAGGARLRDAFAVGLRQLVMAPGVSCDTTTVRPSRWHVPPTRRQEILNAAVALVGERGYTDMRVEDVGKAVGIAGPSVLQHFTTKQEILVAAFDRGITQLMVSASVAIEGVDNADDALRRLISGLAETTARNQDLFTMLLHESGGLEEAHRDRIHRLRLDHDDIWAMVICQLWGRLNPETARAIARAGCEAVLSGLGQADDPSAFADLAAGTLAFVRGAASTFENSMSRSTVVDTSPTRGPVVG